VLTKLTFALIVVLAVALVAGAAVARPAHKINCKGKYPCVGTPRGDTMFGTNGYDRINSKGGNDYVYAGNGSYEHTNGGSGKDNLRGQDGVDYR